MVGEDLHSIECGFFGSFRAKVLQWLWHVLSVV